MLLFYYDRNVFSLTAQARNFALKKLAGFHWDFSLLGCICFIDGLLNVPLPEWAGPPSTGTYRQPNVLQRRARRIATKDHNSEPVLMRHQQDCAPLRRATRFPLLDGPRADSNDE